MDISIQCYLFALISATALYLIFGSKNGKKETLSSARMTEEMRRGVEQKKLCDMKVDFSGELPQPILVSELMKEDHDESRDTLIDTLSNFGFVILKDEEEGRNKTMFCRDQVSAFFDLPLEEKSKLEVFLEDEVTGRRRVNRGYIPQPQKEFFKARLREPQDFFPNETLPEFYPKFNEAVNHWHDILEVSLAKIGRGKSDSDKRLIPEDTLVKTAPFRVGGSSLSVIRYHEMAEKGAEMEEHVPCDAHYDTGILTMIRLSEVPGLQIENRETKEWIPIETVGKVGDLAMIMGRKIELLTGKGTKLKPTLHRVQMSKNVQRHSILYFFDLQTSPHD